jgi:hypothetical protein
LDDDSAADVSSQIKNPISVGGRVLDVFMEIYAITVIAALAGASGASCKGACPRVGRPELERAVRLVAVVKLDEDAIHPLEMAAVDDHPPIHILRARGADEAARPRVASEASRR